MKKIDSKSETHYSNINILDFSNKFGIRILATVIWIVAKAQYHTGTHGSRSSPSGIDSMKLAFMSRVLRPAFLEHQGAVPPDSNLPWRDLVYLLAQDAPLFRGMPTGSRHFGTSRCVLATVQRLVPSKKAFCQTRAYVGRSTNTSYMVSRIPIYDK